MCKDGGFQGLCHPTKIPSRHKLAGHHGPGVTITVILQLKSLRLCPVHTKSLIALESFRMFLSMNWWLSFSLSAYQWGLFPNSPGAN